MNLKMKRINEGLKDVIGQDSEFANVAPIDLHYASTECVSFFFFSSSRTVRAIRYANHLFDSRMLSILIRPSG